MPFPKLDDADCLIRKPIGQMKWNDILEIVGEQTLAPGAKQNFEDLMELAGQHRKGGTAYAKVGLVKKHLVIRVKSGNSHIGDDDVILVKNFVMPEVDQDKHRQLSKKPGKPELSVAWWTGAKGDEVSPKITVALQQLENARRALAEREGLGAYADVLGALNTLESVIRGLLPSFGHSEDHKTMLLFQEATSREVELVERALAAYEVRIDGARANTNEVVRGNSIGRATQAVERLEESLRQGDVDGASPQYGTAADYCNSKGVANNLRAVVGDSVRDFRVNPEDLPVTSFVDLLNDIVRGMAQLKRRVEQARVRLDELEDQNPIQDPPETNGVDMVLARQAMAGYQQVFVEVKRAAADLDRLLGRARQLVANPGDPEQAFELATQLLEGGDEARQRTEEAVGLVRNSGSRFVAMKIQAGIPGGHPAGVNFVKLSLRILSMNMHTREQAITLAELIAELADKLPLEIGGVLLMSIGTRR